jgi:hypothetical protein
MRKAYSSLSSLISPETAQRRRSREQAHAVGSGTLTFVRDPGGYGIEFIERKQHATLILFSALKPDDLRDDQRTVCAPAEAR